MPTRSASRPWPHASWNSTPPAPALITTGSLPLGAGRAFSLSRARRAAVRATSSTSTSVEQLEADRAAGRLEAGLHAGVAGGHALHHEEGAHLVVVGEQAVAVGDEDAPAAVGVGRAAPGGSSRPRPRAAASARWSSSTLRALGTSAGYSAIGVGLPVGARLERDLAHAPTAGAGRGRGRLGRGLQPRLGEVGGVGEAGGVAAHDPDAGARSRPDVSSSTRPSSRRADESRLSSANTSAKSPPVRRAAPRTRWTTLSSITWSSRNARCSPDVGGSRMVPPCP